MNFNLYLYMIMTNHLYCGYFPFDIAVEISTYLDEKSKLSFEKYTKIALFNKIYYDDLKYNYSLVTRAVLHETTYEVINELTHQLNLEQLVVRDQLPINPNLRFSVIRFEMYPDDTLDQYIKQILDLFTNQIKTVIIHSYGYSEEMFINLMIIYPTIKFIKDGSCNTYASPDDPIVYHNDYLSKFVIPCYKNMMYACQLWIVTDDLSYEIHASNDIGVLTIFLNSYNYEIIYDHVNFPGSGISKIIIVGNESSVTIKKKISDKTDFITNNIFEYQGVFKNRKMLITSDKIKYPHITMDISDVSKCDFLAPYNEIIYDRYHDVLYDTIKIGLLKYKSTLKKDPSRLKFDHYNDYGHKVIMDYLWNIPETDRIKFIYNNSSLVRYVYRVFSQPIVPKHYFDDVIDIMKNVCHSIIFAKPTVYDFAFMSLLEALPNREIMINIPSLRKQINYTYNFTDVDITITTKSICTPKEYFVISLSIVRGIIYYIDTKNNSSSTIDVIIKSGCHM